MAKSLLFPAGTLVALCILLMPSAARTQEQGQIAPNLIPATSFVPSDYRMAAGDVLSIVAYGTPELNRTVAVSSEGTVATSYLEEPVTASGKTTVELGHAVAKQLQAQKRVLDPQIEITVLQVRSHAVTINGEVRQPTVLYLTQPISTGTAILRAGGVDIDKAGSLVTITSSAADQSHIQQTIPLTQLLAGGQSDPLLFGGESVTVSPGGEIFVAGAVKKPGGFPISATVPLTASKAVALAEGWLTESNPDRTIIVRQTPGGQSQLIPIDLKKALAQKLPDIPLMANDLIVVPYNGKKRAALYAATGAAASLFYALGLLLARG